MTTAAGAPRADRDAEGGSGALLRDLRALPNLVSLGRVAFVYVAIWLFYDGRFAVGLAVGVLAGWSDYLDGYLARRLKLSTRIGALIDQAADVLFITGCIFIFVRDGTWPWILIYVVLLREIMVLNLRASAAEMGFSLPSIFLGKLASNFQFWALALMGAAKGGYIPAPFDLYLRYLGHFGIAAGTFMSLVTASIYLRSYARRYKTLASTRAAAPDVADRGGDEIADRGAGDDR